MSRGTVPPIVLEITKRLRHLLTTARNIKTSTSIEPPLPTVGLTSDISHLTSSDSLPINHSEDTAKNLTHAAVECAARAILYEKIGSLDVQEPDFVDVWNLLDIIQSCADYKQCDVGLSLWLIEEMLDSQTIDGCRYILEYLKSRRAQLVGSELSINKRNTILRTCNELLRRLSRAENAVFCGDVFVFLFQVFPLGDKSAVNLRGEFHVENTTSFDPPDTETPRPSESPEQANEDERQSSMQVDREPDHEKGKVEEDSNFIEESENAQVSENIGQHTQAGAVAIDGKQREAQKSQSRREATDNSKRRLEEAGTDTPDSRQLYPDFWSLQHIFSNPQKAFDAEALLGFKKGLEVTLQKFKATPKVPRVSAHSRKRKRGDEDSSDFASSFNPKYLTSRDLFDLELSDLTFQRHVLVQAIILLEFLLSLTPGAKKKTEQLKAQRSMLFNYTLAEEDTKWCLDMKAAISKYLQEAPDGKFYYRMVDNVVSRDKNWVAWKVESCQDISRKPITVEEYTDAERNAKRICKTTRLRARTLGAIDLDFLDEDAADVGMESLRDESTTETPRPQAFVRDVQNTDLDLEMVDKEREEQEWAGLVNKRASKTWRALRLVSHERLSLFSTIDEAKGLDALLELDQVQPDYEMGGHTIASGGEEKMDEAGGDIKDDMPNGIHEVDVNSTAIDVSG